MRQLESREDEARREQMEREDHFRYQQEEAYQEWCASHGLDPDDPSVARSFFGEVE